MKACTKCGKTKALDEFGLHRKGKYGRASQCKACKNERQQARQTDPDYVAHRAEYDRAKKAELRAWYREQKDKPCMDCGLRWPPYVMQFDHLPGTVKLFNVANGVSKGTSIERLEAEIAKCELVCGNCHAIRTHTRLESLPTTEHPR